MNRRWAHQAGHSWRKWGDPLLYVSEEEPGTLLGSILFWFWCICVGTNGALIVWRLAPL